MKANFLFKKQPGQKIIANLKKDNEKLVQLIQSMKQSNDTITKSTITPDCQQNCTIGIIKKVVSALSILDEFQTYKYFLAKSNTIKDSSRNF